MTTAWVAGGTGLVGGALVRQLVADDRFTRVTALGRRPVPLQAPKLAQAFVDFSSTAPFEPLEPPDVALCCLGTTMRRAGSRRAFRAVDFEAVLCFARAAREKGAEAFLHVSSLGADPCSRVFYAAVKGQIEEAVAGLGFPSVYAFRPSMLDGEREERRTVERVGLAVMRAAGPLLGKYRPTPVAALVGAIVAAAKAPAPGAHVVDAGALLGTPAP